MRSTILVAGLLAIVQVLACNDDFANRSQALGTLGSSCSSSGDCASGFCVDGVCCDTACGDSDPADCQACTALLTAAANGTCSPVQRYHGPIVSTKDYDCRPIYNSMGLRPPGVHIAGTLPGDAPCDSQEICDGARLDCPPDLKPGPNTITCRAAVGLCDEIEKCDGFMNECPPDTFGAPRFCATGRYLCESMLICDGMTTECSKPSYYQPADMQLCRAASPTNDCSTNSYCDGTGPGCGVVFQPAGTACRKFTGGVITGCNGTCDAAGVCRNATTPPGTGGSCS